ncbi:AAA family ATPase [Candidatus Gottesmanbacteria bacterium]|nr:AAA family ATPase [Candidatus Gottesmanbacteria bacterium]MBI5452325.1 AAA family ATPase [Candidatus Gottesmanbacteria bacterium]
MRIILIGMKACGKTTVGKFLSQKLGVSFVELDNEIEKKHLNDKNEKLSFREIFKKYGKKYFRDLETNTLSEISKILAGKDFVFACGGGTPLKNKNRKILKNLGKNIFLDVNREVLLERILKDGLPSFFPYPDDPEKSLDELLSKRLPVYQELAEFTLTIDKETPEEIVNKFLENIY